MGTEGVQARIGAPLTRPPVLDWCSREIFSERYDHHMVHERHSAHDTVPSHGVSGRTVRTATTSDVRDMAATLAEAFFDDPVWGPAFPEISKRRVQAEEYWRFVVNEAIRFPDSLVSVNPSGEIDALSVWFPPGAEEIGDAMLEEYDMLVRRLLGAGAAEALFEASERFGAARPTTPHAYLTLLAVASSSRGRGAGMTLLSDALERFDAQGIPTYLESSNPVNDRKYEALGYLPHGIVLLEGGQRVQTYWRDAA